VKKNILVLFLSFSCFTLWAQDSTRADTKDDRREAKRQRISAMVRQEEEGVLSYYKQSAFGLQLRTNGYGLFYELGRMKSPRITNTYTLELTEIKHPKEEKFQGSDGFFGNTFIYGKINNFYQARLGFGKQYIFGQKGNKNGIAVIGLLQGGLSLGLLKPYYIELEDMAGQRVETTYAKDSATYLSAQRYFGSSGFSKGWSELEMNPGVYAKTALRFDFGRFNESISALEIGISVDAFSKKVELIALNPYKQLFYQGHIAFVFGRRR
jgi:hypothetical protein